MENAVKRNEAWQKKASELYSLQLQIKKFQSAAEAIEKELKEMSGNQSSYFGPYYYNMIERKGSIDYNSIPGLKALDLEQYRKPGVISWRLTYKQELVGIEELVKEIYG